MSLEMIDCGNRNYNLCKMEGPRAPRCVMGIIRDLECRAVLRPRAAVIVDAGGGDVGVAEPFLHLGDVGLVIERVGGGRRAQRMRADLEPELRRIGPHQPVDAVRGDRAFRAAGAVVADRPEQRAGSRRRRGRRRRGSRGSARWCRDAAADTASCRLCRTP